MLIQNFIELTVRRDFPLELKYHHLQLVYTVRYTWYIYRLVISMTLKSLEVEIWLQAYKSRSFWKL